MPQSAKPVSTNPFWSCTPEDLLKKLDSSDKGLTNAEAERRVALLPTDRHNHQKLSSLVLLIEQFKSPIILILLFAVGLSFYLKDGVNGGIILTIVLLSGLLGFFQERGAANAVEKLLAIIQVQTRVMRDGVEKEVEVHDVVPGDIVILNAGDVIPGDCLLLETNSLFINEAALTGETFPAEKLVGVVDASTGISKRTNTLFAGTYAVSGSGRAIIALTGKDTEFGKVSESLKVKQPETEFEHGIRRFGYLLMEVTLVMVISIFAINVYLNKPVVDSLLFALALAVGLTPQLLPAIISVNLAHGARKMADAKVIVKRLSAIENFGSMDVLCSDKTGTLTLGEVKLESTVNIDGQPSDKALLYAKVNAHFQTGYSNPIDLAIIEHVGESGKKVDITDYKKLDEEPYDFIRKRLSILAQMGKSSVMITKGALTNILEICTKVELADGKIAPLADQKDKIQKLFEHFSAQGFRVVGIAYRDMGACTNINKPDEIDMTFLGLLALFDPMKPGTVDTVKKMRDLGISMKLITGDNRLVAAHVGELAGLSTDRLLTGPDMSNLSAAGLRRRVENVDVFAEIEPSQKERLIRALKEAGHVVGYIGDGINDASALHVADIGISVANAVDVAKEAANIVLLEKDLLVLVQGVREGRLTFANTLKYVFMATSANFGNMFSMAGASLFLPFLPLMPTQILLGNLLTDLPEMTIATDSVDPEMTDRPHRWDISFIRRFMMVFGLVSSIFDYLTFGVLMLLLHASPVQFRTGWFVESVVSASMIVLVIRTRMPFYKSKPGKLLMMATAAVAVFAIALPYTPLAKPFGFAPMSPKFVLALAGILVMYVGTAEVAKFYFYRAWRLHKSA